MTFPPGRDVARGSSPWGLAGTLGLTLPESHFCPDSPTHFTHTNHALLFPGHHCGARSSLLIAVIRAPDSTSKSDSWSFVPATKDRANGPRRLPWASWRRVSARPRWDGMSLLFTAGRSASPSPSSPAALSHSFSVRKHAPSGPHLAPCCCFARLSRWPCVPSCPASKVFAVKDWRLLPYTMWGGFDSPARDAPLRYGPMLSLDSRPRGVPVQLHLRLRVHRAAVRDRDQFQRTSLHGGDGTMLVRLRDEQGKWHWMLKATTIRIWPRSRL